MKALNENVQKKCDTHAEFVLLIIPIILFSSIYLFFYILIAIMVVVAKALYNIIILPD